MVWEHRSNNCNSSRRASQKLSPQHGMRADLTLRRRLLEAPLEEYEKCGFALRPISDGSIDVKVVNPTSEGLAISCSLSVLIWGPGGNFIVDPDEDGILVHIPVHGQPFVEPTNRLYRKCINQGKWFVDIFYGLDSSSTNIAGKQFGESFTLKEEAETLIVKRKFVHKMYCYKWPYVLHVHPDGLVRMSLRRPVIPRLYTWLKKRVE